MYESKQQEYEHNARADIFQELDNKYRKVVDKTQSNLDRTALQLSEVMEACETLRSQNRTDEEQIRIMREREVQMSGIVHDGKKAKANLERYRSAIIGTAVRFYISKVKLRKQLSRVQQTFSHVISQLHKDEEFSKLDPELLHAKGTITERSEIAVWHAIDRKFSSKLEHQKAIDRNV